MTNFNDGDNNFEVDNDLLTRMSAADKETEHPTCTIDNPECLSCGS